MCILVVVLLLSVYRSVIHTVPVSRVNTSVYIVVILLLSVYCSVIHIVSVSRVDTGVYIVVIHSRRSGRLYSV